MWPVLSTKMFHTAEFRGKPKGLWENKLGVQWSKRIEDRTSGQPLLFTETTSSKEDKEPEKEKPAMQEDRISLFMSLIF